MERNILKIDFFIILYTMSDFQKLKSYKPDNHTPTSMITLVIPPDFHLGLLRQKMTNEQTTATNIRNNSNRKSVQAALTRVNTFLSGLKTIPSSGIAIFAEQYI